MAPLNGLVSWLVRRGFAWSIARTNPARSKRLSAGYSDPNEMPDPPPERSAGFDVHARLDWTLTRSALRRMANALPRERP